MASKFPDRAKTTAWVGHNLPKNITDVELKEHFHYVEDNPIVALKSTAKGNRVAYVTFTTSTACDKAVEQLDGTMLKGGWIIRVNRSGDPTQPLNNATISLGRLPSSLTDDRLREVCSNFGSVVDFGRASLGPSARVEFSTPEAAEKALQGLSGMTLGRAQIIAKCVPSAQVEFSTAKVAQKPQIVTKPPIAAKPSIHPRRQSSIPREGSEMHDKVKPSIVQSNGHPTGIIICEDSGSKSQSKTTVWVGYNLPKNITDVELKEHFRYVEDNLIVDLKSTAKGNRVAYVTFTTSTACDKAVQQLDGTMLKGGWIIRVNRSGDPALPLNNATISLGGLPSSLADGHLRNKCSYFGSVVDFARAPLGPSARVEFSTPEAAEKALQGLSGITLGRAQIMANCVPSAQFEFSTPEAAEKALQGLSGMTLHGAQIKANRVQAPSRPFGEYQPPPPFGQHQSPSPFGQHQPPSFEKHQSPSPFGQHQSPSPFGQHQPPSFEQHQSPSPFGQHQSPSPFGQHQPPSFGGQHQPPAPVFGQHQSPSFGQDSGARFSGSHKHQARLQGDPGHISKSYEMSPPLHKFFAKYFRKDLAKERGVTASYSEGSLHVKGPKKECDKFHADFIAPLSDRSIKLVKKEWNNLVTAQPSKSNLFQQIVKPYQSNPRVCIENRKRPFTMIVIVGCKDAVKAASDSFLSALKRSPASGSSRKKTADDRAAQDLAEEEVHLEDVLLPRVILEKHVTNSPCKPITKQESPGTLIVSGKKEDVKATVAAIEAARTKVQPNLHSQTISVDRCFELLLRSEDTVKAMKSIEKDSCVSISLPSNENETFMEAEVSPSVSNSLQQPRSPVGAILAQWQFKDDDLIFKNVSELLNMKFEEKYSVNPSTKFQFNSLNCTYKVDFTTMTQTDVKIGKERRITRTLLSAAAGCNWYWKDDKGVFQPYPSQLSAQMNGIRVQSSTSRPAVNIQDRRYTFDFINMKQINADTGYKRDIRFVAGDTVTRLSAKSPSVEQKPLQITVKGLEQDIKAAETSVSSFIKKQEKREQLSLPKSFQPEMESIVNDWCSCYGVNIVYQECSEESESVTVCLRGWKKSVDLVKIQFLEKLTDLQAKEGKSVKKPAEWIKDSSPGVLKLVPRGSEEYGRIAFCIRKSAPNIQVEKVERVQNEWLWEKYYNHRELIKKKNHRVAKELELFHGTSSTAPEHIYQGEEGFDMRFSRAEPGLWGTGNYFAFNASYSHNYRYTAKDGSHQMFLATVLIGDSYDCEPDRSLLMPPAKPIAMKTSQVGFQVERYDSVTGVTNGSQVYIIYDNSKAYPKYLITYNLKLKPNDF